MGQAGARRKKEEEELDSARTEEELDSARTEEELDSARTEEKELHVERRIYMSDAGALLRGPGEPAGADPQV